MSFSAYSYTLCGFFVFCTLSAFIYSVNQYLGIAYVLFSVLRYIFETICITEMKEADEKIVDEVVKIVYNKKKEKNNE